MVELIGKNPLRLVEDHVGGRIEGLRKHM